MPRASTQRIRIPLRTLLRRAATTAAFMRSRPPHWCMAVCQRVLIDDQCIRRANLRPMDRAAVHRCALVCRRTAYKPRLEAIGR
jgi:hypothetical protein